MAVGSPSHLRAGQSVNRTPFAPADLREYVNQDQPNVSRPVDTALPTAPVTKWRFPAGSVTAIELDCA